MSAKVVWLGLAISMNWSNAAPCELPGPRVATSLMTGWPKMAGPTLSVDGAAPADGPLISDRAASAAMPRPASTRRMTVPSVWGFWWFPAPRVLGNYTKPSGRPLQAEEGRLLATNTQNWSDQ